MGQKILVFAGKKQSGKSSAANFVAGYILTQMGRRGCSYCPTNFTIDEEGQLIVNTESGDGILDLNRKDEDFAAWASYVMWPSVKLYAFADLLKYMSVVVFGIDWKLIYGTDEDKNQLTHIRWKDMCKFLPPRQINTIKKGGKYDSFMTGREFSQYFGTNVCRVLDDDCFIRGCFNEIFTDGSEFAIIQDARFAQEVKSSYKLKETHGIDVKVIKLTRNVAYDVHESENDLRGLSDNSYDLVIDNEYTTIHEKNQIILDALYQWGWLSDHIGLGE